MPQYQGVWTLPVAARLQSTQQWVTDPLYRNTTLLLQADNAANGAQNNTFLDSSSNNFTITRNGNTTQGTFTPFSQSPGWWGNYFDRNGAYLTLPSNTALSFGTGDFTVEGWFYIPSVPGTITLYSIGQYNTDGLLFRYDYFQLGSTVLTPSSFIPLGVWFHCAVTRSGTSLKVFINGSTVATATNSTNHSSVNGVYIATSTHAPSTEQLLGYISNFRIIKGTALYTSNFTPSPIPLTAITNTSLLTCQSNRFVDNSTNNFTLTVTGTPSVQAFSPFAPQYQYTPSVTGGSGYFDGTTDYLQAAAGAVDAIGTGDFQISGWWYLNELKNYQILFDFRNGTNNENVPYIYVPVSGTPDYYVNAVSHNFSAAMKAKEWTYILVSRVGSTTKAFMNGTEVLSYTDSTNYVAGRLTLGFNNNGTGSYFYYNGYIAGFRVVVGTGTTSGTIPTSPPTAITNTKALLNFTNAGIYDGTLKNNLETVGNAQVSTSVVKYGTGSMYFDGTGDYLKGNQATSNLYVLEGDFTIEMWVYSGSFVDVGGAYPTMYATSTFSGTGIGVKIQSAGGLGVSGCACVWYNGSQILTGTTSIANSTWTHVAVSRINGFMRLFVNGTQQASTTNTATFTVSSGYPLIGADTTSTGTLNGYIDDLRITKGIARYTANFTPPTVALPRQ